MRNKLILIGLLSLPILINAQQRQVEEFEISGKVIDAETQQPLEYATIVLTSKRTKKVTGGLTDTKGEYKITVPKGKYDISIEFISFKTHHIYNKEISKNINFGAITLEIDSENLDEVIVKAEKTTVEIRLDKKIYNVGKDLTVRGASVSDLLDNVPSVSVDVEGNVALRGNDNVRILINGKPSGLVGLNSTEALRQLPADAIEKVEVITSPSARYDAEGTAGILNIILRRSKLQGLNGAITTNIGYPNSAGISGNLNYRTGDFNFFTTSGYNYRESPGNSFTSTNYVNSSDLFEEKREFERISKGYNINAGVEWYVNKTASLTVSVLYQNRDKIRDTKNNIFKRNVRTFRLEEQLGDDKTIQYSFNFDKKFKKDGEKFTFDFQYEESNEDENSLITQDGIENEKVKTLEDQQKILLQSDYVLPIGKNSQFEIGYRGNFNTLNTNYRVDSIKSGIPILNTNLSNILVYKQYTNAFYTQYGSKINKFSYLLGLRLESTQITIDQLTSNEHGTINYAEFFPTINLGYEISDRQSVMLGYNRRIRRPRSRSINPFPSRSSATNLYVGNPNLNPSFSNAIDLGYLNRLGKLTLNSSIYYQHSTGVFSRITEDTGEVAIINGEEISIIKTIPVNLATNDRFGFEFNLTYNPSRKWRINGDFNLFKSVVKGDYNGQNFDADNTSWNVRLNNKITLPGKIDWQTRVSYRGPRVNAQNIRKGVFGADLAFSKDLFKENASITFNISDVFNSRKSITETDVPNFFTRTNKFQWRERSFTLSFTYRFKQKKKRPQRSREDYEGGEEEGF